MTYKARIIINALPKITSNGSHGHWASRLRERKKWHKWVADEIGFNRPKKPLQACRIECVRYSAKEPDFDNLAASFKPVIDGLKNCGVIEDDKSSCVVERVYRWAKAPMGKGAIEVVVDEIVTPAPDLFPEGGEKK